MSAASVLVVASDTNADDVLDNGKLTVSTGKFDTVGPETETVGTLKRVLRTLVVEDRDSEKPGVDTSGGLTDGGLKTGGLIAVEPTPKETSADPTPRLVTETVGRETELIVGREKLVLDKRVETTLLKLGVAGFEAAELVGRLTDREVEVDGRLNVKDVEIVGRVALGAGMEVEAMLRMGGEIELEGRLTVCAEIGVEGGLSAGTDIEVEGIVIVGTDSDEETRLIVGTELEVEGTLAVGTASEVDGTAMVGVDAVVEGTPSKGTDTEVDGVDITAEVETRIV